MTPPENRAPITLTRTGDAPLRFTGELVREVNNQQQRGKAAVRYHDLAIYRTADARYILAITFITSWKGETNNHRVEVCSGPDQVREILRDHNPVPARIGFPPTADYADRQSTLVTEITGYYESLVTELLSAEEFTQDLDGPKPAADRQVIKRSRPRKPNPHLKRLEDMPEPELREHFADIIHAVDARQPDDVIGSMVISFLDNGILQYVASIDPETAPAALRELANRLEQRTTGPAATNRDRLDVFEMTINVSVPQP